MKNMIKKLTTGLRVTAGMVVVAMLLGGCASKPSISVVEQQVREDYKSQVCDIISVKVLETGSDKNLKNVVTVKVEIEAKFKETLADLQKSAMKLGTQHPKFADIMEGLNKYEHRYGNFKNGETKKMTDVLLFEQGSNGEWSLVRL